MAKIKHSQSKSIRVNDTLRPAANSLAALRARTLTQLVNDLILRELVAEKMWPNKDLVGYLEAALEAARAAKKEG